MKKIGNSELILNDDGSVYHINLLPEDIADNIILVGDQDRVKLVSSYFDNIRVKKQKREFVTHTGTYKNKEFTAISTGIGTDNIDIVINELDALVNIDLKTRMPKKEHKSLNLIRIGTTGALQGFIDVNNFVISKYSIGLDGLAYYYKNADSCINANLTESFIKHLDWDKRQNTPYAVEASEKLVDKIYRDGMHKGITMASSGFYGPQGRELRLKVQKEYNETLESFAFGGFKATNFEMESSALYFLSKMLGHEALTVCIAIANRVKKEFSKDYKIHLEKFIGEVLDKL